VFICVSLFSTLRRGGKKKKYADLFALFFRVPPPRIKRKSTLIQTNRSAEFFRANLREPFFHTPPRRKEEKKTLIQINRSAEFFRVNPRETLDY
jgi:hypothetical protein